MSITEGKPGTAAVVSEKIQLNGVAATACESVGSTSSTGMLVPITSGTPGKAVAVSRALHLYGVTRANATTYEAVGEGTSEDGAVVTW